MVEDAANTMFAEYWEMTLHDRPEEATSWGEHKYNDRLTSYSLNSYEKRKVMMNEFLERANQMLPLATEGSSAHDNLLLFIIKLQYNLDQVMIGSHLFPVSFLWTPQMSLRFLLKYTPVNTTNDYWNLISRYRSVPKQIDEIIELMKEGIRTNMTLNKWSMDNLKEQSPVSAVEESPFYKPFLNISEHVQAEDIDVIRSNATDAVEYSLTPAFQRLSQFIKSEYKEHLRPEIGAGSLPNGHEFYRQQLNHHLTANVTAEEIHEMGKKEVERISKEMQMVIESLGLNLTREEFSDQLRNNESQFFSSEEEALDAYRATVTNEIEPKLSSWFKNIPKQKLVVEKIPSDIAGGPRAYYLSGSADGSTAGTFYLDTTSLSDIPKYEMVTLAMHEGVPGHHLQIAYSMEQTNVPKFRKYLANSNAYVEGWALYAEYLGYEMGLYEDPFMLYGHLSEEIFRACRMVVDTGMHVFGWSRQDAIDYMMANSASTLGNIEREVDRYITWPGQACAYKYGEMKIKDLRKAAESELGAEFDVKEFHDVILRNNGPLAFVEKQMDIYLAKTRDSIS